MKTSEIRTNFIEFFKKRTHTFVPSASTIPVGDKTILFTVAGMAQFKSCFTGQEKRPYVRATNSQKCIRVADLDDVGKDGRHLTMFEMLGSWSFGDYYKKEAIAWAYEFVRHELKLNLERLWVSVHHTDQESLELWREIGVPETRIVKLGDKDNFWAMGPTGPCGPCTELYLDQGAHVGSCAEANLNCKGPGCDCDRFLEFWNLVFMQYNRDESGNLHDLPMKSVDTGMGLERVSALLQGKTNVFETDVFLALRTNILNHARLANSNLAHKLSELTREEQDCTNVIADHIRLLCFTIADGAYFSNEGRGYVLRRVLRRAVRYVNKLCPEWDKSQSFLAKIVHAVVQEFGTFFPELSAHENRIQDLIFHEEIKFNQTLESGLRKFYEFLEKAKLQNQHKFSGENVFVLHDTFGFPADLTRILCAENHFEIDMQGYELFMHEQKQKSRADAKFYKFAEDTSPWTVFHAENAKEDACFSGYGLKANVRKDKTDYFKKDLSFSDIKKIRQLQNGCFELVIKNTPFYAEGGGQIADVGFFEIHNGEEILKFNVIDVKKTPAYITHILHNDNYDTTSSTENATSSTHDALSSAASTLSSHGWIAASQFTCFVDLTFRKSVARHHTATHLLHKALQVVLGGSLRQSGSLVKNDMLRFDFSHNTALTQHEIQTVEDIVNEEILKNSVVSTHANVPLSEAKNMGAMAMFNEKYEDNVRVLQVANFSLELCGGTHVEHTGDIGQFKILSENGVTSGVRRIEAVAGFYALDYSRNSEHVIERVCEEFKCAKVDLFTKILTVKETVKNQEKIILDLQNQLVDLRLKEIFSETNFSSATLKVICKNVPNCSLKELELLCDKIKARPHHIAILGCVIEDKAHIIAGMHSNVLKEQKNIHLGKIVLSICEKLNGKGGGRPDFARGSGTNISQLNDVLAQIKIP